MNDQQIKQIIQEEAFNGIREGVSNVAWAFYGGQNDGNSNGKA